MQAPPKFTSFKHKLNTSPDKKKQDDGTDPSSERYGLYEFRHELHNRSVKSELSSQRSSSNALRHHQYKHNPRLSTDCTAKIPASTTEKVPTLNWTSDTRANTDVLKYGFHRGQTSLRGHHLSSTRVLGISDADGERSDEFQIGRLPNLSDVAELESDADYVGLSRESPSPEPFEQTDFIPISPRKRRRLSPADPAPLIPPSKENADNVSSMETNNIGIIGKDANASTSASKSQAKHNRLQSRIDHNPQDPQAWLEMAIFQDEWVASGLGQDSPNTVKPASRDSNDSTTDRLKISIFEDAIKHVPPGQAGIDTILAEMMSSHSRILSTEDLLGKWKALIRQYPSSKDVWKRYFSFLRERGCKIITFEQCEIEFVDYLKLVASKKFSLPENAHGIQIFTEFTNFLFEAGYIERAVAFWQAFLEIQFFRPSTNTANNPSASELSQSFGDFWESESPRIGETDAHGWCNTAPLPTQTHGSEDRADGAIVSKERLPTKWAMSEIINDHICLIPGRTVDDEGEDEDPFHVILLSDIEPLIGFLALQFSPEHVIDGFLRFCRLPSLFSLSTSNGQPEIAPDTLKRPDPSIYGSLGHLVKTINGTRTRIQKFSSSAAQSFRTAHVRTAVSTLFSPNSSVFASFNDLPQSSTQFRGLTLNVLELLATELQQHEAIAEYYIALEGLTSPKRARNFAKSLLKERPSSLRLYNAFALLESREGNHEAAERVCSATIDMSRTFSKHARFNEVFLHHTWAWEALMVDKPEEALRRIFKIYATNLDKSAEHTPQSLIEAETKLKSGFEHSLQDQRYENILAYIECLALLSYLSPLVHSTSPASRQPSLALALHIYQDALAETQIPSSLIMKELLYQSAAYLIHHHAQTTGRAMQPPTYHEVLPFLREAIIHFPNNTALYAVLSRVTPKGEWLRALISPGDKRSSEPVTVSAWVAEISKKLARHAELGSIHLPIRATFQHATQSQCGQHCAMLWAWWLAWEVEIAIDRCDDDEDKYGARSSKVSRGQKHRLKRAKDVWLAGWEKLPALKDWLLFGLVVLGDALTAEEAKQFFNVMVERGIRFRKDLSELMDDKADGP